MRLVSTLTLLCIASASLQAQEPSYLNLEKLVKEKNQDAPPRITLVDFEWIGEKPKYHNWLGPHYKFLLAPVGLEVAKALKTNSFTQRDCNRLSLAGNPAYKIVECSETELTIAMEGTIVFTDSVLTNLDRAANLARLIVPPRRPQAGATESARRPKSWENIAKFYESALDKRPLALFEDFPPEQAGRGSVMYKFLNRELEFRAELYELRLRKAKDRAKAIVEKRELAKTTFSLQPDGSLKITTTGFFGPDVADDQSMATKVAVIRWGDDKTIDSKSESLMELEQDILFPE